MNTTQTIEKTDAQIKIDVLSELKYDPYVKVTNIGVLVKDGTVTLNGYAASYSERMEAVRAAKRVAGVMAIADEIEVQFMGSEHHHDTDIAAAATQHIGWSNLIPRDGVQVTVQEGWITLNGEVEWQYQKNAACNVVEHLSGVNGVTNSIVIKPKVTATAIETAIESAFKRNALLDTYKIRVEPDGHKVTLRGNVRNLAELYEAARVAWAAPGVSEVDNQLTVKWVYDESR